MIFLNKNETQPSLLNPLSHNDKRGNLTVYSEFNKISIVKITTSKKNSLRGFHYQTPPSQQNKLIYVLEGKIQDVLIRIEDGKLTNDIKEFNISHDSAHNGLFVPKNWAHAYLTLSNSSKVMYLCDFEYANEVTFNPIKSFKHWRVNSEDLIISKKDLS